ncbi:unnamed protein product [Effrenium voratum]|nr:unnamed protein product [Effrenium voratum]
MACEQNQSEGELLADRAGRRAGRRERGHERLVWSWAMGPGLMKRHLFGECAQSKQLAHAVAALGMLKDQGAVLPSNTVQRVQRLLDLDRVAAELPELVLMFQGLRGLSLDETRLGLGLRDLQRARLALRGAGAVPVLELCEVLQLLLTCGRLTPEEPFVFDYFRLAANNVDRRSKRKWQMRNLFSRLWCKSGAAEARAFRRAGYCAASADC